MKKFIVTTVAVGLIGVFNAGAYAHYEPRGDSYNSQTAQAGPARNQGQSLQGRGRGNRGMYQAQNAQAGRAWNQGMQGNRWNTSSETFPCVVENSRWNIARPGWRAQAQTGTASQALQLLTEAQAKDVAETHINQYLPGYTIEKIEHDNWRPLYFVTLKGENDAVQQLTVHGFAGQVMNVFPQSAE